MHGVHGRLHARRHGHDNSRRAPRPSTRCGAAAAPAGVRAPSTPGHRAAPHPGHGADVVLMPVRDDHGLDLVAPLGQEARVRQDLLHAQVREAARGPTLSAGAGSLQAKVQH